jgi:hypothetical protein
MIVGTAALMAVERLGGGRMAGFFTALGVTTLIRLLAIRLDWRLPRMNAGGPPPGGAEPGTRADGTPPDPGPSTPDGGPCEGQGSGRDLA